MGRQIRIYQTQKDVEELCKTFYPKGVVLFDRKANMVEDYTKVQFTDYFYPGTRKIVGSYFIAYRTTQFDKSEAELVEYPSFWDQIIQFKPCQETLQGEPYYNDGRFYLYNTLYNNEELVKLYNSLVRYVKKNYKYHDAWYFAPDFIKACQKGEAIPCNGRQSLFDFNDGAELERVLKGVKFN